MLRLHWFAPFAAALSDKPARVFGQGDNMAINRRGQKFVVDWWVEGRRCRKFFDRQQEARDFAAVRHADAVRRRTQKEVRSNSPLTLQPKLAADFHLGRASNYLFSQHFTATPFPLMQLS